MSNYEECWKRLFWNFANKGEQENMDLMIDIENECIGPMDENDFSWEKVFGAESSPIIWDSKEGQLIDPPMFTVWIGNDTEHFNTFEEALEFAKNDIEDDEEAQITISYYETLKEAEELGAEAQVKVGGRVIEREYPITDIRDLPPVRIQRILEGLKDLNNEELLYTIMSYQNTGGNNRLMRNLERGLEAGDIPIQDLDGLLSNQIFSHLVRAEEFGAEEFDDMGFSLKMDRFSYQNEGKVRDIDGKELRQYRIYFGKEPMFYLNDAVFGYDNNNTVQGVVDDLNEALQDSIKEVFQRLLWKSQRPDSLDVMLRGEEFDAEGMPDIVIPHDVDITSKIKKLSQRLGKHRIMSQDLKNKDFEAEGINLRKRIESLIDLREVNFTGFKKDTKREAVKRARRIENEIKGVLPKGKSYKVDKPKWFKIAQTGIVLGVAGLVGYSGFKGKE